MVVTRIEHSDGHWDAAFAPLVEVFRAEVANGAERGDLCVMLDGNSVVDLRGGYADPATGSPWQCDTLACCFSVSKGVFSLLAHRMMDLGLLDPDWPVVRLWPEFDCRGKEAVTIADVLTHRAGLAAVSGEARHGDLYDWQRMTSLLASSAPVVSVRAKPVYHNMTYGFLIGEILQRAGGRSIPELLAAYLTGPLDADFLIGLSPRDMQRCARLTQEVPRSLLEGLDAEPETLFARSMIFFSPDEDFNSDAWRGAIIGSGSGHATARAIATLYGQLIWQNGLLSPGRQLAARAERTASDGPDPVMGVPIRYAEGFELSLPPMLDFGPNPESVGHWGAGGATAFADPAAGLSFGYVTGHMANGLGSSRRARAYVDALYDCL